jgi:ATP-dependent Clp protease ATP-binding subunit ClpC
MATHHVPVFVWQNHGGHFSACPVQQDIGGENPVAVDSTAVKAIEQVKSYLLWRIKRDYPFSPDFHDPRLIHLNVTLRPEYLQEGRVYPCGEEIEFHIPCVHGQQEAGLLICSLPTLSIQFYYHKADRLKSLVMEKVRQKFAHKTPQELSLLLPPKLVRLEDLLITAPKSRKLQEQEMQLPILYEVAHPLGESTARKRFFRPYQRDNELQKLTERLRSGKTNVILVGEHRVGKTTLLTAAVRNLERLTAAAHGNENQLKAPRYRFWGTTAARLIAGMKYLGQWEERFESLVAELSQFGGVLCAESLLDLVVQGGRDPQQSIAAFLLPYLQSGELCLVCEATPAELDACRRLIPGLVEVFQVLRVPNLKGIEARNALFQLAETAGRDAKVNIDPQVPERICRLFSRFLPYSPLPGQAALFLTKLIDRIRQERRGHLLPMDVVERFIQDTGLPEDFLQDEQPLEFAEITTELGKKVIGQPEAVQTAARTISTFKAGLNDPCRPLGVFLFSGPTGVGKTELAKAISNYLFGHGATADRLVRLDMSEYSSPYASPRLITREDGTPSKFISQLRQQPFSVVLLDEIEKAAPEVFDILLGVLDEGRLTDRYGRTTSFASSILIMSSNLGAKNQGSIGFSDTSTTSYEREIQSFFRPEFYNRIDSVVTFHPLSLEVCTLIVRKELDEIAQREGIIHRQLQLTFSERMVAYLIQKGFDARYGARPLQRTLENQVVTELSKYVVSNPTIQGTQIHVDLDKAHKVVIHA